MFRYLRKIIKKSILGQPVAFTDFFGYLVGEQLLIGVRKHVYEYQCVSPVELTDGRGEEGGWARSQIIRPREKPGHI